MEKSLYFYEIQIMTNETNILLHNAQEHDNNF